MKLIFSLLVLFFSFKPAFSDSTNVFDKWNSLDKKIASKQISKKEAIILLGKYADEVSLYYFKHGGTRIQPDNWVFPLSDFSSLSYYKNGNDYNENEYDYFDGNESWNHPANDICIPDTNKDSKDDITGNPVNVISMSGGVVIANDTAWEPGSILRAGKYVRVFDPANNYLLYYSHLSSVNKKPGDLVKPGDKIGEVGRTGRSMILSYGDTHLHIALLTLDNGCPAPEPLIKFLKRTEEKYKKKLP